MAELTSVVPDRAPASIVTLEPQRPLRIALLGYRSHPFSVGQGVYLKYVSRALTELGHQVDVISGEPYPALDNGVRLITLPGLNLFATDERFRALRPRNLRSFTDTFEWLSVISGGFPEPYTFARRIRRHMRTHAHRYDIVHDNQTLGHGILALARSGMPVITTIHHPITHDRDIALAHSDHWGMRLLIRRWHRFLRMQTTVARQLKHIVTVSEQARSDIAKAFGVPLERIRVVPNGIDAVRFRPVAGVPRDPNRLIVTASADQPLKGVQHLIPAFARLRAAHPELRLTLVGRPRDGGPVAQLIERFGLTHCIDVAQAVSNDTLVDLYARASIAVVPSEYEGFGLPAAEAMACEVPVVVTDGGALPEVVGTAGRVVPRADPEALAAAIGQLLADPAARARLGQQGRKRVLARFDWRNSAHSLVEQYRQAIAGARR